ncbi:MAG: GNAT family N-acetyltransferase [Bacteroidota bacterium]
MPDVEHQPDAHRFIVATEAGEAELTYTLATGLIVFTHTGVPKAAEGQGIGKSLAEAGLAYAREEGLRVLPLCPFVKSYMHRHPETHDLLTKGFRV